MAGGGGIEIPLHRERFSVRAAAIVGSISRRAATLTRIARPASLQAASTADRRLRPAAPGPRGRAPGTGGESEGEAAGGLQRRAGETAASLFSVDPDRVDEELAFAESAASGSR